MLRGDHLPSAYEGITERLVDQLSNTDPTVRVVPGGGHASNLDNSEFFTAALGKFLAERVYGEPTGSAGGLGDATST